MDVKYLRENGIKSLWNCLLKSVLFMFVLKMLKMNNIIKWLSR